MTVWADLALQLRRRSAELEHARARIGGRTDVPDDVAEALMLAWEAASSAAAHARRLAGLADRREAHEREEQRA